MKRSRAFSLVEVVLALGIAAFALLIIVALLPVGVNTLQSSAQETAITNLVTGIVADLYEANGGAGPESARYKINVNGPGKTFYLDEGGEPVAETDPAARFRAVVKLTPPPPDSRLATGGSVTVYWPAQADNAGNSVTVFVALNKN